MNMLRVYLST